MKNALAWTGHYPIAQAHQRDGRMDEDLGWSLWGFQRDFNLTQDGLSRPYGETTRRLNQLIAPMIELARADRHVPLEQRGVAIGG